VTLYERFEKLSEVDNAVTTRGRFLGRAAKACLGLTIVAAGLAKAETARAGAGCCILAYQTQCPNCTGRGYDCGGGCTRWAWYCVDPAQHHWLCGECYAGGGCPGCSCGAVAILTNSGEHLPSGTGGGLRQR
jgi:hypothetical protein